MPAVLLLTQVPMKSIQSLPHFTSNTAVLLLTQVPVKSMQSLPQFTNNARRVTVSSSAHEEYAVPAPVH